MSSVSMRGVEGRQNCGHCNCKFPTAAGHKFTNPALFFFPSQEAVLWDDRATYSGLFINSNKNSMSFIVVLWSLACSLAHQMLHHVACCKFLLLQLHMMCMASFPPAYWDSQMCLRAL